MKTFKQMRWFAAFVAIALLAGCGKDFVDLKPEGSVFEENYYRNESECYSGLIAVYDVLRKQSGGFENMLAMMNAGSDDFYAGGGGATDGTGIQSFSNYSINEATVPGSFWSDFYSGIARANILIAKLPEADFGDDEATRVRFTAEARALRAYYYFQLVTLFRNIPLITQPLPTAEIYNQTQADPADVYAFIESEMQAVIGDLPPTVGSSEYGRLTQGAAKAILGKVYLYQSKWSEAAAQFADVNGTPGGTSQYGYRLLGNFSDLWVVSNKWNTEGILEISHTSQSNAGWGNWGSSSDEGNSFNQMVGPRSYVRNNGAAPDFWGGWSFNPPTQKLVDAMTGDPRFNATILNMDALVANGSASYTAGYMNTGYFLRKFMPLKSDVSTGGGNAELNFQQNTYAIRLADTYLMEAEALVNAGTNPTRAKALLTAVRTRVGLGEVDATLENIYKERRLELAGEGWRWFDLVRTGRAAAALGDRGFQQDKNEVFPIPQRELQNTKLVQNPGYN
ncbi:MULTISPECIES: RagB/SusD family nutrient uptake outer membrane protein [unclassified Flavobacterium]|uniref:RagB/SusD family nutrient uptake outer membrane protein n=1 Tax=unclassified Flavobacterium TaxID=196869 RepID=UPI001F145741|nr:MULTISPECIES: RagB/SusD family nutrient uptake outer membrane protein [unclassified Flavobacterium]UMY67044.1 RagB/SusD family nutrient uptake outer membrane protein [Flavobacterium sp. HJ-32-4]